MPHLTRCHRLAEATKKVRDGQLRMFHVLMKFILSFAFFLHFYQGCQRLRRFIRGGLLPERPRGKSVETCWAFCRQHTHTHTLSVSIEFIETTHEQTSNLEGPLPSFSNHFPGLSDSLCILQHTECADDMQSRHTYHLYNDYIVVTTPADVSHHVWDCLGLPPLGRPPRQTHEAELMCPLAKE